MKNFTEYLHEFKNSGVELYETFQLLLCAFYSMTSLAKLWNCLTDVLHIVEMKVMYQAQIVTLAVELLFFKKKSLMMLELVFWGQDLLRQCQIMQEHITPTVSQSKQN